MALPKGPWTINYIPTPDTGTYIKLANKTVLIPGIIIPPGIVVAGMVSKTFPADSSET